MDAQRWTAVEDFEESTTCLSNVTSEANNAPDSSETSSESATKSESDSISGFQYETEVDPHSYPPMVSLWSDCMYREDEYVCMDCWLHYVRTGTRWSPDANSEGDDDESEDEISPFHIHT